MLCCRVHSSDEILLLKACYLQHCCLRAVPLTSNLFLAAMQRAEGGGKGGGRSKRRKPSKAELLKSAEAKQAQAQELGASGEGKVRSGFGWKQRGCSNNTWVRGVAQYMGLPRRLWDGKTWAWCNVTVGVSLAAHLNACTAGVE
jgi:hypothetical protein